MEFASFSFSLIRTDLPEADLRRGLEIFHTFFLFLYSEKLGKHNIVS